MIDRDGKPQRVRYPPLERNRIGVFHRAPGSGKAVKKRAVKNADTIALERRVSNTLGLTVTIDHRTKGGVLHIHYRSLDQLEEVLQRLEKN